MTRTADLLKRLSKEGVLVPPQVKKAMLKVNLEDFTDYDVAPFSPTGQFHTLKLTLVISKQYQHHI